MKGNFTRIVFFASIVISVFACKHASVQEERQKTKNTTIPVPAIMEENFKIDFSVMDKKMGSIDAYVHGKKIKTGSNVKKGEVIKFSVKPNPGHVVDGWNINGKTITELKNTNEYSSLVDKNLDIKITLKNSEKKKLTFSATAGGSLKAFNLSAKTEAISGTEIAASSKIKFTADADEGFALKCWKKNNEEVKLPTGSLDTKKDYTINIQEDTDIKAVFEKKICTVDFSSPKGVSLKAFIGNEELKRNAKVEYGKKVHFKAEPEEGYEITGWTVNKQVIENSSGKREYDTVVTQNLDIKLLIQEIPEKRFFTVNFNSPKGALVKAFSEGSEIKRNTKIAYGKKILFTAEVKTGYKIIQWLVNKKEVEKSEDMSKYEITLDKDIDLKVTVKKIKEKKSNFR